MIKKYSLITLLFFVGWVIPQDYTVKLVTGSEIEAILPAVAQLWVEENAHFPYLFKGTLSAGFNYFQQLTSSPRAAFIVAYDTENNIIGFLSGAPLCDFANHYPTIEESFINASMEPKSFYYFSDIIIVPTNRKQGLGKKLFELLEAHVISLGYTWSCLVCESHLDGHPLKPKYYYELDNIWKKFGYQKTDMIFVFPWDTIQVDGTVQFQEHEMSCWVKKLIA